MAKIGRPRALDEFKRREIFALVAVGCGIEAAARYVGCNAITIRREALRNPDFHDQLRHAELAAEIEPLQAMKRAAATHWRAAAWLLERTHPNRFGRRDAESIRPEQLDDFMLQLGEAIAEQLPDGPDAERVVRHITAMARNTLRQEWAAKHTRRDPRGRQTPAERPVLENPHG
jgi:tRNA-dihydrouridine synthase